MSLKTASREQVDFRIHGMDCAEEVALLRRSLSGKPGIENLMFSITQARMTVDYDPALTSPKEIEKLVAATGLRSEIWSEEAPRKQPFFVRQARQLLVALSGASLLAGFLIHGLREGNFWMSLLAHEHHEHHTSPEALPFFLLAIATGMYFVVPKALRSLREARPDMNALVLISATGACILQEWMEAGTLSFLFGLSGFLENWSVARARVAIGKLLQVTPATAAVVHHDHVHELPVQEVRVGSIVRVKPGERIPFDGEVVSGGSWVDQALITGESVPVWKQGGDPVYAGSLNHDGMIDLRTTRLAAESTVARIIRMVEESQHRRARTERWVDSFALYYTPLMIVVAILVAVVPPLTVGGSWTDWFYQGMLILLISCPCALVISTPVTIVSALTAGARQGILVKGGVFLEATARLRAVAFDKTGVLTQGKPRVRGIYPVSGMSEAECLARLAAVEAGSRHPLAQAILDYAATRGVKPAAGAEFQSLFGKGAEAKVEGERFWVGSHRLLQEKRVSAPDIMRRFVELEQNGSTVVAFGRRDEVLALVELSDPPRPEAAEAIAELRRAGIQQVSILTGDNLPTAQAIGRHLNVQDVRAELLPEDKVRAVEQLRERYEWVAMVGDGVNDAQAMAASNVGIALAQQSTDVILETADVVLIHEDLRSVSFLIRHARRTMWILKENVAIALALKAAFMTLALAGKATLWMAVLADMGATIIVTFNALRILRARRQTPAAGRIAATPAPEGQPG